MSQEIEHFGCQHKVYTHCKASHRRRAPVPPIKNMSCPRPSFLAIHRKHCRAAADCFNNGKVAGIMPRSSSGWPTRRKANQQLLSVSCARTQATLCSELCHAMQNAKLGNEKVCVLCCCRNVSGVRAGEGMPDDQGIFLFSPSIPAQSDRFNIEPALSGHIASQTLRRRCIPGRNDTHVARLYLLRFKT